MAETPFFHIRSAKLRVMPGEDSELVNEGMYGKACAIYVQSHLAGRGYSTPCIVCEDWGWWVEAKDLNNSYGIGIYGMRIDTSDELDLCVTVLSPQRIKWSWKKLRLIDTSAEVNRLYETIRSIFKNDDDITIVRESPDFPLGH